MIAARCRRVSHLVFLPVVVTRNPAHNRDHRRPGAGSWVGPRRGVETASGSVRSSPPGPADCRQLLAPVGFQNPAGIPDEEAASVVDLAWPRDSVTRPRLPATLSDARSEPWRLTSGFRPLPRTG